MPKVINLNQARKQKARADKATRAADNRIAFGRTKAEKEATKAEEVRHQKQLDAHRLGKDKSE
ncbi:DUF4169 family protein [Kiloniella laminariae]|uniref:DUF4169 family protein n=1 Tax=Kiloniella laminariae TaxID=454162 RepID=A0ABT4LDQ6_9PROT|nr:DUF4169 family protein [Kiloniella laminariae]MCZ4279229.1 DUF4169 family protein [Kiloniella laminariae]